MAIWMAAEIELASVLAPLAAVFDAAWGSCAPWVPCAGCCELCAICCSTCASCACSDLMSCFSFSISDSVELLLLLAPPPPPPAAWVLPVLVDELVVELELVLVALPLFDACAGSVVAVVADVADVAGVEDVACVAAVPLLTESEFWICMVGVGSVTVSEKKPLIGLSAN